MFRFFPTAAKEVIHADLDGKVIGEADGTGFRYDVVDGDNTIEAPSGMLLIEVRLKKLFGHSNMDKCLRMYRCVNDGKFLRTFEKGTLLYVGVRGAYDALGNLNFITNRERAVVTHCMKFDARGWNNIIKVRKKEKRVRDKKMVTIDAKGAVTETTVTTPVPDWYDVVGAPLESRRLYAEGNFKGDLPW